MTRAWLPENHVSDGKMTSAGLYGTGEAGGGGRNTTGCTQVSSLIHACFLF